MLNKLISERKEEQAQRLQERNADVPAVLLAQMADYSVMPRMICKDGFSLSVQASAGHYCEPRYGSGPYSKVEVGFPSEEVPTLSEYKEDAEAKAMHTVFAYVPVSLIEDLITQHGGFSHWEVSRGL